MLRKYLPQILILFTLCISCKKESTSVSSTLVGTWELRTVYTGGWGPNRNYPPGNGNYLKFTKSTFERDTNRVLLNSGSYSIVKEKFNLTGKMGNRIIYNHEENSSRTFVDVSHDSLTLSEDAYDGGGALYIRIE